MFRLFSDPPDQCLDIEFVPPQTFTPVLATAEKRLLFRPTPLRDVSEWEKLFHNSKAVHFFSSTTNRIIIRGNPLQDAYSYLGPTVCPNLFPFMLNKTDDYLS